MDGNQGLYSKEIIANLLNLSERRIEQLAKMKIIPKAGRGVFDLGPTVQAYVHYLQGLASGAIKNGEPSELDKRLLEAKVLERESKARILKCRADEMERALKNEGICEEIKKIPDRLYSNILYKIDHLSDRSYQELHKVLDGNPVVEIKHELNNLIYKFLNGLKNS